MAFQHPSSPHQPTGYASTLAQPLRYNPPPAPVAPPAQGLPALPVPVKSGRYASVWFFAVIIFFLLVLIGYFLWALGPEASGLGLLFAVVPFAIVFFTVMLIDRWEPEPMSLLIFAVGWGAVMSVVATLGIDLGLTATVGLRTDFFSAVIQAPVVEELTKGIGIVLIFLMGRRAFDGPVDGVVYGALVGAGFAFTENIQYFAISAIDGGFFALSQTFAMRGIMSPFAHAMFTAATGFAIGLAVRKFGSISAVLGFSLIGYAVSVVLHAIWNGSAMVGNFFELYAALQVPLFIGYVIGIIALRKEEARLTRARLGEYAAAGWFTPQEVDMLATPAGRKVGMQWARSLRGDRAPLMKSFIKDAANLAAVRQRTLRGNDRHASHDEQVLLHRTRATRQALLS